MGRDALHRHVTDTEGTSLKDRFFGLKWQLFETKAGSNTVTRNVWSPAYVDALVLRDRDTDSNGTLDERIYPLQDGNWNTTALVTTSGTIVERETYNPFGVATYRDASGAALSGSSKDWVFLHQGGEKIAAGDYEFRNRIYSPTLGRWLSNDPLGFDAGDVNTYRALTNNPILQVDPTGKIPPLLILGGMALGWLLFDPPPAQAPTQPGETVVPPPNPGEKAIGVALGAGVGVIAVGVGEVGTVIVGAIVTKVGTIIRKSPTVIPKSRADLHMELRDKGYTYHGTSSEGRGYTRYRHVDGSEVQIRPNGEVLYLRPKVQPKDGGKWFAPRTDANGKPLQGTHNTGEFVEPLPK